MSKNLKIKTSIGKETYPGRPDLGNWLIDIWADLPEDMSDSDRDRESMNVVGLMARLYAAVLHHGDCKRHNCDAVGDSHMAEPASAHLGSNGITLDTEEDCLDLQVVTSSRTDAEKWELLLKSWLREILDPEYRKKEIERRWDLTMETQRKRDDARATKRKKAEEAEMRRLVEEEKRRIAREIAARELNEETSR
ncbi:hypothetical protein ADK67_44180 [Saccharothrix sp. NRRL B-16348]|uniref:hypothetical protein n=1 Tax=Saccharothrix sp. NRRL B-16348 TaxID=1415542 RepID=UPI0006AFF500|nr:hypothetical protein [Saccharothrix sp. NRRL B-16348]KOX13332.1 hypothetical protein ADK67_44180 [Saccharothrix sp. NRRL B-16348]